MSDPTFGLTPGREIDSKTKQFKDCRNCHETVLLGQVQDVYRSLKWHVYDAKPLEHNGQNYYRRHQCKR